MDDVIKKFIRNLQEAGHLGVSELEITVHLKGGELVTYDVASKRHVIPMSVADILKEN